MSDPRSLPLPPDVASSRDDYARRFAGPVGDLLLAAQRDALRAQLAGLPPGRVLDVGGGHAQLIAPLRAAGHDVTVLGSRPGVHGRARRLAGEVGCLVGELEDPPLRSAGFDLAVCFRIFAHTDDWRRLLTALCRVARRGVVVEFPASDSANVVAPLLFPLKRRVEGDTRRFRVLRLAEVASVCRAAGCPDVAVERELLLPLALHRAARNAAFSARLERAARRVGLTRRFGSPVVLRARRGPGWAAHTPDAPLSAAGEARLMPATAQRVRASWWGAS